jgi:hypothetical protein
MKRTATILMVAILACSGATASAIHSELALAIQDQPFTDMDKNKDGFIDRGEGGAAFHKNRDFETADANKDGKLNRNEYDAYIILRKDKESSGVDSESSR